jgi:hypothetical protein
MASDCPKGQIWGSLVMVLVLFTEHRPLSFTGVLVATFSPLQGLVLWEFFIPLWFAVIKRRASPSDRG